MTKAEPASLLGAEPDTRPLIKGAQQEKERHEAWLAASALPLFDVGGYVDDFNSTVVGAYGTGRADAGLPADRGVALSMDRHIGDVGSAVNAKSAVALRLERTDASDHRRAGSSETTKLCFENMASA